MISRKFLTAGHAIFTVSNGKDEHYTFRVTKPADFSEEKPIYFVGLLTGAANTKDYTYYGYFFPDNNNLSVRARYGFEQSKPFLVAAWALTKIWHQEQLPEGYKIQHCGKCAVCGRTLTTPASLESGIGPTCEGRV